MTEILTVIVVVVSVVAATVSVLAAIDTVKLNRRARQYGVPTSTVRHQFARFFRN